MKHSRFAVGLLAAALLMAPIAVLAQNGYGGNGYNNVQGQTSGVISAVNGSALLLQDGRTIFLHNGTVINPSGTRLQPGMQISVTGPSAGDGNVNANQINIANNGSNTYSNGNRRYTGTISSVNGEVLKLQDGRTIFLHNGTVINPSGTRLQSGMQISVTGPSASDGDIHANQINVANNGNYTDSNGNRQYTGTISSMNGDALLLQDGRTIFLHYGTVVNPSGTRLQPGMRITVTGSSANDGNINAREVDVASSGYGQARVDYRGGNR